MENQKLSLNNLAKVTANSLTEIVKYSKELPTVRNSDPNEVNKSILGLVIDVFAFYNENPNDIQLPLILQQTKENVLGLTLADIQLFKKYCLSGNYELKFRLTPNVFIDWIKEYKFDRMEAFEANNLKAKVQIEKEPISEKTVEMLKKLAETVKPKVEPIYSTDESKYIKEAKKKQQALELEFEKIWREQGCTETEGSNPVKFINEKGKFMVKVDYVKFKFENGK